MGNYDDYLQHLVETAKIKQNTSLLHNDFISDQVVSLKGNRVYTYTRDRIEYHNKIITRLFLFQVQIF